MGYFSIGTILALIGSLRAVTRTGHCESLPSAEVATDGFQLNGSIYQLIPDCFPNGPFVVFANHTQYGFCLKAHLTWMPGYTNLTLVCDCAGSDREPTLAPLVFVEPNKFAILYGCKEHGNGLVSEGAIAFGYDLGSFNGYQHREKQATIVAPFFPFYRRLHETMAKYTMDHDPKLVCNFRREFYLQRGPTKADLLFIMVFIVIAVTILVAMSGLLCSTRLHGHRGQ
ncbi:hypothetical protein ZHAS_00010917 [Anopheles sinensis]|uniref:Uncharacterized protein n=1 Tax=Anopheles sinensis TaxID=74873 RepID=A0A084VYV2_ANOSI|nr:hypothetical protein ZHAS_00010917 [Anopheles sinensis]